MGEKSTEDGWLSGEHIYIFFRTPKKKSKRVIMSARENHVADRGGDIIKNV